MKMIKNSFTKFCCAAIVAASMQASGSVITTAYSDRAVWTSAATNLQMIDFEGIASLGTTTWYGTATGLYLLNDVRFTGILDYGGNDLMVANPNSTQTWYQWDSGAILVGPVNNRLSAGSFLPYIHIVFVTPITAFGLDLMSTSPTRLSYSISLDGNTAAFQDVATYERPTRAFWGVISDTPFTTVDLKLPNSPLTGDARALIDNVTFGDAGQPPPPDVPEACTLLLIGSGLVTMVALQRRLRRKCRVI